MKRIVYILFSLLLLSLFIEAKAVENKKNTDHHNKDKKTQKVSKKKVEKKVKSKKLKSKETKNVHLKKLTESNVPSKKPIVTVTRGDVKIIEASENIRYLSQKIVNKYLLFYINPKKTMIKNELMDALSNLSSDFRIIATTTKDADTKDILEFLAYSKDQIEEIFNEKPNEERAALMLDYSETLLEGADSIANSHMYDFSEEEKMLMVTKKIEYLLERITKYYMAIHVGFNTPTNKEQLNLAMNQLELNLQKIDRYRYTKDIEKTKNIFISAWKSNKNYFDVSNTLFIPNLMFLSVNHIESLVDKLALYHSQNQ